jgi:hypothetical protein
MPKLRPPSPSNCAAARQPVAHHKAPLFPGSLPATSLSPKNLFGPVSALTMRRSGQREPSTESR